MSKQIQNLTYKGQTKTVKEWGDITGLGYKALMNRIYRGWSAERCIEEPVNAALNKTGPSKNDAELMLNEVPFDQLHPDLQLSVRRMGYKGKKFGREIRDRDRPAFDKWYDKIFVPNYQPEQVEACA